MSLSASVGVQIPTNVVEVGNEISQNSINALAAATSPSTVNPFITDSALTTQLAGYQVAGSYLTDAPSNGSEYVRLNGAWAVATGGGGGLTITTLSNGQTSTLDATVPTNGMSLTFDSTAGLKWATVGGGGGLTVSTLSNGVTSTLDSTAPTTGQALTYDGTNLKWASVGGGGVAWGGITGTVTNQTDLVSYISGLGYITSVPTKTVNNVGGGPYTISLADCDDIIYLTGGGGMGYQITADNDTGTAYPNGSEITIVVDDTSGVYSIVPASGVAINTSATSFTLSGKYVWKLVKVAANTWYIA